MPFKHAAFLDVAEGLQPNQFTVGDRTELDSLDELPEIYRRLMTEPVTAVLAVMGGDGRPSLTPVWFGHDGDEIMLNFAEHRRKTQWIRDNPEISVLLMNPENPYHWMSIKATVSSELHEDDEGGEAAAAHIDEMWTKYTGSEPPYGLRDPQGFERRVLFRAKVDSVATFGQP